MNKLQLITYTVLSICIHATNTLANTRDILFKTIEQENIQYIDFSFITPHGKEKGLTQPIKFARDTIKHGTFFDGSSVPGYTSIDNSDLLLMPDVTSFARTPHEYDDKQTLHIFCYVHESEHERHPSDPRSILKQTLDRARKMGYEFYVGPEIEFFLFDCTDEPADKSHYFDHHNSVIIRQFKRDLLERLTTQQISVEKIHCEVAPGQHEFTIRYNNALSIADQIMRARNTVTSLAEEYRLRASFLPKPLANENGSGMHVHFSLYDVENKKNAFYDKDDPLNLSEIAHKFIAGVLQHIDAITAIANPTHNSYKRLVPGYEAPIYPCWGSLNRSALIRIPFVQKDRSIATRAELRSPDSTSNPYLLFAALLTAGLDGIENNYTLEPSTTKNVYLMTDAERELHKIDTLPTSLKQAHEALQTDPLLNSVFGDQLIKNLTNT